MLDVVGQAVFEVLFGLTGHLFLWAVTLGRWDISNGRDDTATVVGIVIWIVVGVVLWLAVFR